MNGERRDCWLCLHFPDLPLEVFSRGLAEGAQPPLVILERQRVVFLNPRALTAGIRPGNSLETARSLASETIGIDRDPAREQRVLRGLADWSYGFTPRVALRDPHSLLLEVAGCLKLFGGLPALARRLRSGLAELGHQCRLASAATPLQALLLAKAGVGSGSLPTVPLIHAEISPSDRASLHQMGIRTLGQLLALPRAGLTKRFGSPLVDYLSRLTGERQDPQLLITPAPDFAGAIDFAADVTDYESLRFPMKRLATELAGFLAIRQLGLDRFTWVFGHRHHGRRPLTIRLAGASADPTLFLRLTQVQLERFEALPEVDHLGLLAREFVASRPGSDDLFRDSPDRSLRPSRDPDPWLLDLLRARLGPRTCFRLTTADDHRPEQAWMAVPADEKLPPPAAGCGLPRPSLLLHRPRRLTRAPLPIASRRSSRATSPLELLQGPERIDAGWWEDSSPRDYYVARHASGAVYWVFQCLEQGDWYLHGYFA